MPVPLKILIAFNLLVSLVIWAVALTIGGGMTSDPFPPDHRPATPFRASAPVTERSALDAPPTIVRARSAPSGPPDPAPARWRFDPDGTLRMLDGN